VCDPGRKCPAAREFTTFCRSVYAPPYGFSAMKLDADLDGATFHPCPGLSTGTAPQSGGEGRGAGGEAGPVGGRLG
jgi:hypothetical protein